MTNNITLPYPPRSVPSSWNSRAARATGAGVVARAGTELPSAAASSSPEAKRSSGDFCQAALDGVGQRRGKVRPEPQHRRRRLREVLGQHLGGRLAVEGPLARGGQVGRHAQRVEIAPAVHRLARRLLRAHRARGAHHLAGRRVGGVPRHLRDAEVGDHRPAAVPLEEDVLGLHVAVHHALPVGVGERPRHLAHDLGHLPGGKAPEPTDLVAERLARDVSHHEEHEAVGLLDRVDRNDVGVGEPGRGAGLAQEARAAVRHGGQRRREELDGHEPVEGEVARQEHDAHPAATEHALDGVAAGHGLLQRQEFRRGRHGRHRKKLRGPGRPPRRAPA